MNMTENETTKRRINSVDLLRGLVMVIMLLDHTREFVHAGAFVYSPTDLSKTTVALFFTRWITHLCAPTFVFLAGTSIYLQRLRGKSTSELSRFLLTRGLWLIVLEFTVVRLALFFDLDYSLLGVAEVIWIFGVCMMVLAGLVYLPRAVVGVAGIAIVALHNLLDPVRVAVPADALPDLWQSMWMLLHQPGMVPLFGGVTKVFVAYTIVPWVGVMAAGYWLGSVYAWEPERRRRFLFWLGAAVTVLFVLLRLVNVYGDPSPWSTQPNPVFTVLSFLNTTKYPASLLFLLMTLGPALLILAAVDNVKDDRPISKVLITFGRVPLFYFVLQMFVAHAFGVVLGYLAGFDVGFLFTNFPFGGEPAPAGFGFPLWVVYAAWISGLLILYPLCARYAGVKRRNRHWVLSYL